MTKGFKVNDRGSLQARFILPEKVGPKSPNLRRRHGLSPSWREPQRKKTRIFFLTFTVFVLYMKRMFPMENKFEFPYVPRIQKSASH